MKLETICLHGGHTPDVATHSRAVPVYRTSSFVFRDTEHAANLFALKELGNIYTRLMNPTKMCLSSGWLPWTTALPHWLCIEASAIFYSIINLCQAGDEIVTNNLYGGSYTQFKDILLSSISTPTL